MRRIGWLGVGLAVGVALGATGLRRSRAAVGSVAPGNAQATFADLDRTVRAFVDDVRVTMVAREADLRSALGIATSDEAVAAHTGVTADNVAANGVTANNEEASARGVR